MTIDVDLAAYSEKTEHYRALLVEKQAQRAAAVDPIVQQTLDRSIVSLSEMLSISEKIFFNLQQIRRFDAKCGGAT